MRPESVVGICHLSDRFYPSDTIGLQIFLNENLTYLATCQIELEKQGAF